MMVTPQIKTGAGQYERVEIHFMPIKRKWRVLIDGKAFPRRFSDHASAMKEFERQKAKAEGK